MLTVRPVHPFVSFVRDNPFGSDHFASTCLLSIDHIEYFHLLDVFLLFSLGLIDPSYRDTSFLDVVSHHLVAFLVKAVFHHPVNVLAVQQSSFLHGSLQTAVDVVDVPDD